MTIGGGMKYCNNMLTTDLNQLFLTITSDYIKYIEFLVLLILIYILAVAFVRILFLELYKIIFVMRTPIATISNTKQND